MTEPARCGGARIRLSHRIREMVRSKELPHFSTSDDQAAHTHPRRELNQERGADLTRIAFPIDHQYNAPVLELVGKKMGWDALIQPRELCN